MMNTRLEQFIRYKTNGVQSDFAEIMGWSPQYLSRMLKGGSGIGVKPIVAMLEAFPELNARWLLMGEGAMISSGADQIRLRLLKLLEIEKYMVVMTPFELKEIESGSSEFDQATIQRWSKLLEVRNQRNKDIFDNAYKKQDELCKQRQAKK